MTALVRDYTTQPPTFRHYDNDSVERSRGTFRQMSARELWTNCTLYAIVKVGCELDNAVKQLQPEQQYVDIDMDSFMLTVSPRSEGTQADIDIDFTSDMVHGYEHSRILREDSGR